MSASIQGQCPSPAVAALRRRFLSRFIRDRSGATAVEFGVVALPFFTVMFAILEVALVFFGQLMLDTGLGEAARMIRTGQAHQQGFDQDAFRAEVCDRAWSLIDCDANLFIDVRSFTSFDDIDVPDALTEDGELAGGMTYDSGQDGDVIVARAFFEFPLFTPTVFGIGLSNMGTGNRLVAAAVTFRNEPFGSILEE